MSDMNSDAPVEPDVPEITEIPEIPETPETPEVTTPPELPEEPEVLPEDDPTFHPQPGGPETLPNPEGEPIESPHVPEVPYGGGNPEFGG